MSDLDDEYSEEEKQKGNSRQKPMVAALVNWRTIAVGIPTAGSLWIGMRSDKKAEK